MTELLAPAIDSLYAAFARVPRPLAIDYCPCCFTPEAERAVLTAVPVRDLPVEALEPYAADVMLTVGGVADLRYFLPRLLEIACGAGFGWPDLESVTTRLRLADWRSWPERDAVRGLLTALWADTLAGDADVDTVLCAIGNAEDDLDPYLAVWVSALARPESRAAAVAQLRALLDSGYRSGVLTNAFWGGRDSQAGQVLTWLAGADLQVTLYAARDTPDSEATLRELAGIDDLTRR